MLFSSTSSGTIDAIANFALKADPAENVPEDWQMMETEEPEQPWQDMSQVRPPSKDLEQGKTDGLVRLINLCFIRIH